MKSASLAFASIASLLVLGCAEEPIEPGSASLSHAGSGGDQTTVPLPPVTEIGAILAEELSPIATVSPHHEGIERNLSQPLSAYLDGEVNLEGCEALEQALWTACDAITQTGAIDYCQPQATFFYAHSVPRCAARIQVPRKDESTLPLLPVIAFDVSGEPLDEPPDSCGDGVVDTGEECDDGNREMWDGCDPTCKWEPFTGCEIVIEERFAEAELAFVDRGTWKGVRSHLITNTGDAFAPVDQATCNEALGVAESVCGELGETMPFVSWCNAEASLHQDGSAMACSIRMNVWFQTPDPDFGVHTTALPGILAFTLR